MRLPTVFVLLALFMSSTVSASEAPSGVFLLADLGRAERGVGVRPGFGVGYRFASGWAVSATMQRLLQAPVVSPFLAGPDGEFGMSFVAFPEMRSHALFLSKDWALRDGGDWTVRASLGAHRWSLDATYDHEPPVGVTVTNFHRSGTDAVAKIELVTQIAARLSAGLGFERYWVASGDVDRVALSLRYQFGRAD